MTTTRDDETWGWSVDYSYEGEDEDDEKLHSKNLMSLSSAGNSLFFLYERNEPKEMVLIPYYIVTNGWRLFFTASQTMGSGGGTE